jgi:hypothetical protein
MDLTDVGWKSKSANVPLELVNDKNAISGYRYVKAKL